jgi:hypothetical protein
MKRTNVVVLIGACVAAVGSFLALQAGSLATRWESLGEGVWGGETDPALRQTYHQIGLMAFGFGVALLAMAAWNWMAARRETPVTSARSSMTDY